MRRKSDANAYLAEVPLFTGCNLKELSAIASLTFETLAMPGHELCREGEHGSECFIIVDGEAEVTMAGRSFATIGPGGVIGELALLDGRPRVATVTATTPMRLLALSRREFSSLLVRVPHVGRRLLTVVGARLREMDELAVAASKPSPA